MVPLTDAVQRAGFDPCAFDINMGGAPKVIELNSKSGVLIEADAVGHTSVDERPTIRQHRPNGVRADVFNEAGSTEVGRGIDDMVDRVTVDLHYIDENTLVQSGFFDTERHTEAFLYCLIVLLEVPATSQSFQDAESVGMCFIGLSILDQLEQFANRGWKR